MKKSIKILIIIVLLPVLLIGCSNAINKFEIDSIDRITVKNLETEHEEQISESQYTDVIDGYNSLTKYRNDVGTTLPIRADILLKDGSIITIWGGVGDFLTIVSDGQQFNAKSKKLGSWFEEFK